MMIDSLARKLAVNIKSVAPNHPASVNVLSFSLGIVLNFVFIVLLSMIGSLIFGTTKEAVIVMVSFALLRQMSGGVHLKSGMACIIVSTTGILSIAFLSSHLGNDVVLAMNVLNIGLTLVFSPSRIEKQTRIDKKYFPFLKILSTLLVGSNIIIDSPIIAAAFFVQCLTLIQFRRKGGDRIENASL